MAFTIEFKNVNNVKNSNNLDIDNVKNGNDFLDESFCKDEIHLRIQQRNGRKYITIIEGLPERVDRKSFLSHIKKTFSTNGTIVSSDKYKGDIIQVQGDQRANVFNALVDLNITKKEYIKVHG
jgi:translation initiation factor 1